MKFTRSVSLLAVILLTGFGGQVRSDEVKEKPLNAPHNVKVQVRMEGPYTADVPLQVVCYFKYTPEGAKRMKGAPVELDKHLGGVIASLRERGEFVGDQLETILIIPPKDSIKAKALLLVGLGDEADLSLKLMEAVGRVALREADRLGVSHVAFAPLIRDQGNSKISTGEVGRVVVRGMLLAYDTEKRLQKEGLSKDFTLEQWNVEAGSAYFDDTVGGVQKAIGEADKAIKDRSADPLIKGR
ncbi:MAG TPA: M17 family peptidase N-terminal domain-containing protein [Bryobacteraceae bacterium]|nr:M17 family peptidase N-terminal domain-containing protein [Bryobacteraceae bacterium]